MGSARSNAHGTKDLGELLQPAIGFAAEGWPVHHRVANGLGAGAEEKLRAQRTPTRSCRAGMRPKPGDIFVQPALARDAAGRSPNEGARGFYEGAVAADIVCDPAGAGAGCRPKADMAAGQTDRAAVRGADPRRLARLRGLAVPAQRVRPARADAAGYSGRVPEPASDPLSAERLHRHVEAARLVYRDRDAFLADPSQAEVPMQHLLEPGLPARPCMT